MDFNDLIQKGIDYSRANPATAIAAAFIVLLLLFKKPKLLIILVLLALAAAGMYYILAKLSTTGLEHKKLPFFDK
ncbi:MAG: hypothetical protein HZA16_13945 [Nitrospirae bacterium]|nr:hypothetical protein [Nitrospirota bacterium]